MDYSKIILLAVLTATTLLLATTTAVEGGDTRKLIRAPRGTRVVGKYFVHMKSDVKKEEMEKFAQELEEKAQEDPAFVSTVYAIVDLVGHGLTCQLSKEAVDYVSCSNDCNLACFAPILHYITATIIATEYYIIATEYCITVTDYCIMPINYNISKPH